jgi:hypothetical protein
MKTRVKSGHGRSGVGITTITTLLFFTLAIALFYNTRKLSDSMGRATFQEKMLLVDAVLAGRVFETSINKLPVLSALFEEYEKAQKYFVHGINMTDYDESCNDRYEDSLSGNFDKEYYMQKEYQYKMVQKNKTEHKHPSVCNRDRSVAPYGCCTACYVEGCCECLYDGKKDIVKDVLEPNRHIPITLNSQINRGFSMKATPEKKTIENLYKDVLRELGYDGTEKMAGKYAHLKAFSYMIPGSFFMWHTNRYDNMKVPYRMYIISVDEDGQSAFKYELPNGEGHDVMDFHGSVRLFKNTFDDAETGEEKYLWHSVYSNTHRQSLGFEIRPNEIVALLDSCDTCWDDLMKQYKEIYKEAYW